MKKWYHEIWLLFTSMKTGLVLLGLTVIISAIGTFSSIDFFHTLGFKLLFVLLGVNLIICSINRFKITIKNTFHPTIPSHKYAVPSRISSITNGNSNNLYDQVTKTLESHGYRIQYRQTAEGWAFVAIKRRLGYWGTTMVHIAFVAIIIGVMAGAFGFSGTFMAMNGDTVRFKDISVLKGTASKDYSIRINSIEDRFFPDGKRDNWYTGLSIIQGDKVLARGTLSVNHPFKYDGVYYYQRNYADYADILLEKDGECIKVLLPVGLTTGKDQLKVDFHSRFGQPIPKSKLYIKGLKLQDQAVVYLQVYSAEDNTTSLIRLTTGQSKTIFNNNTITLARITNITGLQVKSDPGVPVVLLGCLILFLGLILSFYWRPTQISGVFMGQDEIGTLLMGMSSSKMLKQDQAEFSSVYAQIDSGLCK